ncbi:MAG TPA: pilin [Candidatus Pacearchaeota archaeon]|nr:pilin [Candidatus Pacearchaeota archaeon]HPR79762.1 pilin [Candidatus Pacearchaeota archaeon]
MEFSGYIIYLFNFSLGAVAVLAFIVIIAAGIKIVQSRGNPSEIQSAKQRIINSLIGLTVILTSYILLTTINPGIINVENISLGKTGITIPIITPTPETDKPKNYSFEEIPIGTLTEAILAGTSSVVNLVPCYEYEHKALDDSGNLIIGNTIDRNKDGKIDKEDALLDKDMFYCIKLLDDAIKQKVEVHLNTLIADLNSLLKGNCSCKRAYYDFLPPYTVPGEVFWSTGDCPSPSGTSYCECCGAAGQGCTKDPKNPYKLIATVNGREIRQYDHDTCGNRLAIECKSQEIKELMGGSKPDEICYDGSIEGGPFIKNRQPFNLLTINEGIKRLNSFKEYYDKEIKALEEAELKMKEPYGERITLAEVYNYVQTMENVSVTKEAFKPDPKVDTDISRYCRESNCVKSATDKDGKKVCPEKDIKYELNAKERVCEMESTYKDKACTKATGASEALQCKEYYSYNGDGATFYYSPEYNADMKDKNAITDATDYTCNIETKDVANEMYGGLIRIGETVDYSEAWGKEVSKRIEKIKEEVQGMYNTGMSVASLPNDCNSSNCTNSSPNLINVCEHPSCFCKGDCCPPTVSIDGCKYCEPKETTCKIKEQEEMDRTGNSTICSKKSIKKYGGCSTCCTLICPAVLVPQDDYWTCPYRSFCMLMKDLYQTRVVERSCFEETDSTTEESSRALKRSKVGYVQKMEEREAMLFELAQVGEIKDLDENGKPKEYESVATSDLIGTVCPDYMVFDLSNFTCDATLSKDLKLKKRFDLFDMLKDSRERLTGCVKGYSRPYKEASSTVRVMSCYEASNTSLTILPLFPPYYEKKEGDLPYINCYPYNSDNLTAKEKEKCFYNINRVGDETDPGCLTITKNYMDNYYCCQ